VHVCACACAMRTHVLFRRFYGHSRFQFSIFYLKSYKFMCVFFILYFLYWWLFMV
jgi:hypothetical protein